MSLILGVDTSSSALSIAIIENGEPVVAITRYLKNSHAEHISSAMNFLLESAKVKVSDITNVAITTGPGSFTGLRIGVSFVKGMFISQAVPITAISSLEIMANLPETKNSKIITAIDARQNRVFYAEFKCQKNKVTQTVSSNVISNSEFEKLCQDTATVITDNLGNSKCKTFDFLSDNIQHISLKNSSSNRAIICAKIGYNRLDKNDSWQKPVDILPNYMQVSYAEKMREKASQ